MPWVVGAVLVAVVVALAVAFAGGGDDAPATSSASSVLERVTSVPDAVFDEVGAGTANNPPEAITAEAFEQDGKPRIAYIGAEYCPYCAAERWAMTLALSRFGRFSTLPLSHSSGSDVFPNTQTFTFRGAEYSSDEIAFTGTETASNRIEGGNYAPLDDPPADVQPILDEHSGGSIPFVAFGNRYVLSGATYDPGLLQGKTAQQIADALDDPDDEITQAVVGSANVLTAAICAAADDEPAVCATSGVRAGAKLLGG